jgi:hypothetical protein
MEAYEAITKAEAGNMPRHEAYSALMRFAQLQKQANESEAQCFSRYIQKDPAGRRLYQAYKRLPSTDLDFSQAHKPQPVAKADDEIAWGSLVHAYSKRYGVSEMRAVDEMLRTEGGQKLFRATMKAERLRNPEFTETDYLYEDLCDQQRDQQREFHKANTRPLFLTMVDDIRRRNPNMTQSSAMDFVRSTPEGKVAWEKYRELDVKADPKNPQDAPLSGRPEPSRAPQWRGEQTSSNLTPPRKFPVADDTPKFKLAEAKVAEENFAFFTKVLFDASRKAGKPWSIDKCISTLRACPAAAQYFDAACGA